MKKLEGTVVKVENFGAFVDIGLPDSVLVHISQMPNGRVKAPREIVTVGDKVTVWIRQVKDNRVTYSMIEPKAVAKPREQQTSTRRGPRAALVYSEEAQLRRRIDNTDSSALIAVGFDSSEFSDDEIANACEYVALLYRSLGGEGLKVVRGREFVKNAVEVES